MGSQSQIKVAIGLVFDTEGRILVALRPTNKTYAGFWEFPGGKVEPHETPEQALKRELMEEVGITAVHCELLTRCQQRFSYPIDLHAFKITSFVGVAYGKEGQQIDWIDPKHLVNLKLLSANKPIVDAILNVGAKNLALK